MVEVNNGQRLGSTRPKFGANKARIWGHGGPKVADGPKVGVNEAKIWGHGGLKLGVNAAQRLGSNG